MGPPQSRATFRPPELGSWGEGPAPQAPGRGFLGSLPDVEDGGCAPCPLPSAPAGCWSPGCGQPCDTDLPAGRGAGQPGRCPRLALCSGALGQAGRGEQACTLSSSGDPALPAPHRPLMGPGLDSAAAIGDIFSSATCAAQRRRQCCLVGVSPVPTELTVPHLLPSTDRPLGCDLLASWGQRRPSPPCILGSSGPHHSCPGHRGLWGSSFELGFQPQEAERTPSKAPSCQCTGASGIWGDGTASLGP